MARFVKVENMDILYRAKKQRMTSLEGELVEFINMGCICAEWRVLIPEEYKTTSSAHSTASNAIKRYGYPIKVRTINEKLYFIRTDM